MSARGHARQTRVQQLDGVQERLIALHGTLGSWRRVAARFPGVPPGTLCAVAHGREPRKPEIRAALGLPPLERVEVALGHQVTAGSVVLRDSRPCLCGCGGHLIPSAWNHVYLPGHRRRAHGGTR